ncbi:MAG: 5-amino-6-(D-ribitylamino)uracil--L-tyrosine 4-hydroxyphenyl transferase CofH [Actinomycetota bacterium]|nr:5-amino-6-(D-ribitylamino)uracil--L-tyrosine 4-hydroxyphenyl transferase CofH [Actinomycetota bacterium]
MAAAEASELVEQPWEALADEACRLREAAHGDLITFSPKVFIPLTKLCRDVCHYCTFAHPPRRGERAYMTEDEVLGVARAGAAAGCHEALFTLGDKPELRYRSARDELASLGYGTTLDYLAHCARLVMDETGLLPHLNPGVLSLDNVRALREVSVSQGLMLETSSVRLSERGGPHFGSPDKLPALRLATIAAAGEAAVPFTTGILIGIGETRAERIEALLVIRELGQRYGHVQEVIIQNFRAKPGTRMASAPEPPLDELLWTCAAARLVLGASWHIQAPPNLSYDDFPRLLDAGIDDWGGVSPVTVDHVNPEAPWPEVERLRAATESCGLELAPRLAVYPEYVAEPERWLDADVAPAVLRRADGEGLAREDEWAAGASLSVPASFKGVPSLLPAASVVAKTVTAGNGSAPKASRQVSRALAAVVAGQDLAEDDVTALFGARGRDFHAVTEAADALRREVCGDTVTYVITRNVNYTNVCYFRCGFCAFSKGKLAENLRGAPYLVPLDEIVRRAQEAWDRGATEICLQGGIHPAFTGDFYVDVCRAIKTELPDLHIHAFSALEVWQGATTLGVPLRDYLERLRAAGLASLPGTAAEILDDEIRGVICPDKVSTEQWLHVHDTAHRVGLRSTTTIMFGHVDGPRNWARHLLRLREQQRHSAGFTEFVPLPFVHMEAPIYLKGHARRGPTFREAVLMHAVARLALHPWITNVQASWVKLGTEGAQAALAAGANDLGGTLMNESISRAAGAAHGQEMPPEAMEDAIRAIGRTPRQRTTLYGEAPAERIAASYGAAPLAEPLNPSLNDARLRAPRRLVRPGLAAAR